MAQLHADSPQPSSQNELERRLAALKETDKKLDRSEIHEGERKEIAFTKAVDDLDEDGLYSDDSDNLSDVEAVLRLVEDEVRLDLMNTGQELRSSSFEKGGNGLLKEAHMSKLVWPKE